MPTGYTSDIYEGKKLSFKGFALNCARAFGACIEQRDDPSSDLLKLREYNTYNKKQLEKERNSKPLTKSGFEKWLKKEKIGVSKEIIKKQELEESYSKMVKEVKNWKAPPSHQNLKKFMLEQLNSSIEWDCGGSYYQDELEDLNDMSYQDYLTTFKSSKAHNIKFYKKQIEKDRISVDNSNKWIKDLYKSLGINNKYVK